MAVRKPRKSIGIIFPSISLVLSFNARKYKHNTMNSSSAGKTYIKMQNQLLQDDDCACFLVEAIAKKSQNIKWTTMVNGSNVGHKRIRRVSLDQFYALVTGDNDAFYKMCMVLPEVIEKVVNTMDDVRKNIKNEAYKGFMENYKDDQPFSKKITISDIPFDVINWYANNSDELKNKVDKLNNAYRKDLNNTQARLEKLNSKYTQGNKPKQ